VVLLVLFGFAIASIGALFRHQQFVDALNDLASQARIAEAERAKEKPKRYGGANCDRAAIPRL
jgi:hypothetical protein